MFRGTLSLTQENYYFIVQIGKNKCSQWTQISVTRLELEFQHFKIFLLSPVRFTKCLGIRVPLRPPRKKKRCLYYQKVRNNHHKIKSTSLTPLFIRSTNGLNLATLYIAVAECNRNIFSHYIHASGNGGRGG
jgi:hypothetical protein